jgi:magnesium transporter
MRHRASLIRRTLTPSRNITARATVMDLLPGATNDNQIYVHDINDLLQRTVADLAAIEDRCLALFGLHASIASNRQGEVSRRLTAVATIFLPITFLVGFFGQNFSALTGVITQVWPSFVILGVLLNVICVVATVLWLGRRGWR